MRRHFLFPREDAAEPSVGNDSSSGSNKSLLCLWLERRVQLAHDPQVARHVIFFWDVAKRPGRGVLLPREYVALFSRVAAALIDAVRSSEAAAAVARRDWLYDSHGGAIPSDPSDDDDDPADQVERGCLTFELFRDALLQVAELLLPVESDASVVASFFLELRACVAFPAGLDASSDGEPPPPPLLLEAATFALRAFRDVRKIRGAFLQRAPPNRDRLADISGLPPPDSRRMSLKQLLLGYNPRKLALSRAFSALARLEADDKHVAESSSVIAEAKEEEKQVVHEAETDDEPAVTLPLPSARMLNALSDDAWDPELAFIQSLEAFPAPRVAVVGPPLSGKTRVAKMLASKLRLRYLSLESCVQMAVDTLRQHRQRIRRRVAAMAEAAAAAVEDANDVVSSEVEPPTDAEAETADGGPPATTESTDDSAQEAVQEEPDPLADVFTSEDLDALLSGLTLSRDKAARLLVHFATASLLAGVGVVLDDVHPVELRGAISVDFLVSLRAGKDDLKQRSIGLACAPTVRVVYSGRELALLKFSSSSGDREDSLAGLGYADRLVDGEDDDAAQGTNIGKVVASSPEVVDHPGAEAGEEQGNVDADGAMASSRSQDEDGGVDNVPKPLTPVELNGIPTPSEPLVPLRSLFADVFDARYREYVERVKMLSRANAADQSGRATASSKPWHDIPLLALQSVAASVNQCVDTISGNELGVSRANASRRATPVNLPAVLAPSDASDTTAAVSRADQLRCLLFDDWSDAIDRANDQIHDDAPASLALPDGRDSEQQPSSATPRWRRLSRWREFCPVTSAHEQRLVLGSPLFAATLAGRVYLFASTAARDVFCAHPLQFLRRDPASIASRLSKVWLLHASTVGSSGSTIASLAKKLQHELDLLHVSPLDALASTTDELRAALTSGGAVSVQDAGKLVGYSIAGAGKWLLTDLPFSPEVATELQSNGCLPDVVIALDESPEDGEVDQERAAIDSLRAKAFSAQLDTAEQVLSPLGVSFKRCRIPRLDSGRDDDHAADALAIILAVLDPLAPRVDRVDDGHVPADLLTATLPSNDPADELSTMLITAMLAPPSPLEPSLGPLLGETHRFCPVSWRQRGALVPGLPSFASCYQQRVYAFAGREEQRAFDRNPSRYVPTGPRETAPLVPLVLLVGVRGSGVRGVAKTLATVHAENVKAKDHEALRRHSSRPTAVASQGASSDGKRTAGALTTMVIDITVVELAIARKRKLVALRREGDDDDNDADGDARIAVETLREHVASITSSWRLGHCDSQVPHGDAAAILLPGIPSTADNEEGATPGDDVDLVVPSAELLTACFALGMFPALVIPLETSESVAVQRRLGPWLLREQASRDQRARERARAKAVTKGKSKRGDEDEGDNVDEEEPVDLEAARAEQVEKLTAEFLADQEAVARALEMLRERGVEVASAIPADGSERQRVKLIQSAVAEFSARKDALFSPCYPVSFGPQPSSRSSRAQQRLLLSRLASGEFAVGKHGTRCPVAGPAEPTRVRTREDLLTQAVVYRGRIYFPGTANSFARFCAQPWAFVHDAQTPSKPPPHSLACSIKGAPHTPTTRLARQIARETGAVYVSPSSAIAWARQCLGDTALWRRLCAMEQAGVDAAKDEATVHAAVMARLQSAECLTRGWVLDNYVLMPGDNGNQNTSRDNTGVPAVRVEPGLLLIVDGSFQSAWAKVKSLESSTPGPSTNSLIAREQLAAEFSAWQEQRLELIERWTTAYGDPLVQLLPLDRVGDSSSNDGSCISFWKLVDTARTFIERHIARVRHHRQLQVANGGRGVTCAVRGIPRTLSALSARSHPAFGTFCPVELRAGRYAATPIDSRALCVDYGAHSYWLANAANLEAFASNPEAFMSGDAANNALELLKKAPVDASVLSLIAVGDCDFPELKGYCPVTFAASKDAATSSSGPRANWATIVKGSVFFRASFEHKVFLMASEAARRQFLADPSRYMGLKLPVKLPPQVTAALATNYPGRLEQELGTLLQDALLTLGSARPKFPGASVEASACVFLALLLQQRRQTIADTKHQEREGDRDDTGGQSGHNIRADDAVDATLMAFERDCQLSAILRRAITPSSPSCGPAIRGVRGLLASSSASSLPQAEATLQDTTAAEPTTGAGSDEALEEARYRFDAITRSDEEAHRVFLEFATSATTKKQQRLGILPHS